MKIGLLLVQEEFQELELKLGVFQIISIAFIDLKFFND